MMKKVLNAGHVKLLRHMGGDAAIVEGARFCFQTEANSAKADENLLKMLVREKHTSPLEHCTMTFEVKAPIFILRQWQRHRIGMSYNEMSLRYCEAGPEFFIPEECKDNLAYTRDMEDQYCAYKEWVEYLTNNTTHTPQRIREIARPLLPLGLYSKMIWTCNMASLYHFLELRTDPHAQKEMRQYAWAICELAKQAAPITMQIMEDNFNARCKV